MENTAAVLCAPSAVNVTVRRPSNRPREYLTEREVEKLIESASENRWGHRDATAILIAYRHGLRASEVVSLRWDDIDFAAGKLHVRREWRPVHSTALFDFFCPGGWGANPDA
jgi:integrase